MDSLAATDRIVAAGAVVTREGLNGTEYLLVHRDYREDWTFPKGKVESGEHVNGAAVREVREETGFAIELGMPLPTQTYKIEERLKDSHYWSARLLSGTFLPNDEVDEIAWLTFEEAAKRLTYEHDVDVLRAAAVAVKTTPMIVLRHTQAMKRADWAADDENLNEPDAFRPLTSVGRIQATMLVSALAAYGISELYSSGSVRCRDTLGPYASSRSLSITLEPSLSEEEHVKFPDNARARAGELAGIQNAFVLCTHRPVLPTVMEVLANKFEVDTEAKKAFDPALTPGSMVVYHRDSSDLSKIVSVERHIH
ncbi:MAG: NUDIX hydrolase [Actinobacteria bacterium]|nr:NUDIX hydrolase [Actinomycetota bacterium]NBO35069.1 NUDIX hydrolase [Actinomycetota bacterium]